jgi:hypothetical protein
VAGTRSLKDIPTVHRIRQSLPSSCPQVLEYRDRHGQHATGGKEQLEESPQVGHANRPGQPGHAEELPDWRGTSIIYELKDVFADAVNAHYLNPDRKTKAETATSDFAISGILSQLDESDGNWVSVAFYSHYGIHDQELLASDWSHSTNGVTTSKARSCQ